MFTNTSALLADKSDHKMQPQSVNMKRDCMRFLGLWKRKQIQWALKSYFFLDTMPGASLEVLYLMLTALMT